MLQHGNMNEGIVTAGQCIGLIDNVLSVKGVIDTIIADAEKIINNRLVGFVVKNSRERQ